MQSVRRQLKCPTCGVAIVWNPSNPYRPFCSERCKNIDLGAWSSGQYIIPDGKPQDSNEDSDNE
jgi:endogenous inhibitor of DNA gyrase (YacG/DUF329 family)